MQVQCNIATTVTYIDKHQFDAATSRERTVIISCRKQRTTWCFSFSTSTHARHLTSVPCETGQNAARRHDSICRLLLVNAGKNELATRFSNLLRSAHKQWTIEAAFGQCILIRLCSLHADYCWQAMHNALCACIRLPCKVASCNESSVLLCALTFTFSFTPLRMANEGEENEGVPHEAGRRTVGRGVDSAIDLLSTNRFASLLFSSVRLQRNMPDITVYLRQCTKLHLVVCCYYTASLTLSSLVTVHTLALFPVCISLTCAFYCFALFVFNFFTSIRGVARCNNVCSRTETIGMQQKNSLKGKIHLSN